MDAPERDFIYSLYTDAYKAQLIRAALLIDVFSPLSEGACDAGTVARACGCALTGMHFMLDYLTSLKVLEKQAEAYSLTPNAATFLVRGRKAYAGDLILQDSGTLADSILQALKSGQPAPMENTYYDQDAWLESYSSSRLEKSPEIWKAAGLWEKAGKGLHVLDVGCGCAIKSFVLARQSPKVRVTCLDWQKVLVPARDLAERWNLLPQVDWISADLRSVELGEDRFDACLMGQVTHHLTERENREFYRRIQRALKPGGILIFDVPMGTGQPDESNSFMDLMLWTWFAARAYSFEEYRLWLEQAGFTQIEQHSPRLLSAVKQENP